MVGDGQGEPDDAEPMPAFLRSGILSVAVFAVATGVLVVLPTVDVPGSTLIGFTVGFSVFMTVYFGSMWAGWLFLR